MRIARIALQNVKSYAASTVVDFERGINAVCGENGAGKSTLLEAIGFTLFGYRPYKLDAFLREGEKRGSITVTVEDDDGCSFDVVRNLGTGAGQAVYDELGQRIAEGEADVRNWILGFLGLEAGADLAKLFEDTVGPPQGTLTAIFLESAAPRAKKFDRLLEIEDYKEASQSLRAVTNLFRDRAAEAERRAALSEGDARRLPEVEARRGQLVQQKADLGVEMARQSRRQAELASVRERLEVARQVVQRAQAELTLAENRAEDARRREQEQAAELERAEKAAQLVEACRPGDREYLEAVGRLRQLEVRRRERDQLRQRAEMAARTALRWEQEVRVARDKLAGLEKDETRAGELEALVPEQERREEAVRLADERVRAREEAARQLPAVEKRLASAISLQADSQRQLARVDAAKPMAAQLETLRERDRDLREESARLEKQGWELKQAGEGLAAAEGRLRALEEESAGLCVQVERLRPFQALALQVEARQEARDRASVEVAALESRLQEARRTRGQVEGGLCPFLHESCRNLRPGVSLDAHFDAVIAETNPQLEDARALLAETESALAEARSAERSLSRLPDLERRAGQLAEERAGLEQERARLAELRSGLASTPDQLAGVQERLRRLSSELARAEEAARVAGEEPGWRRQAEEADRTREVEEKNRAVIEALLEREAGAAESLDLARQALERLGNPRGEALILLQRVGRERPGIERSLERAQRDAASARAVEEDARRALEPFEGLEEEMAIEGMRRDQNESAHRTLLANQAEAERLPQRRHSHLKAVSEAVKTRDAVGAAREALERERSAYDDGEHSRLQSEMEMVAGLLAGARRELELCQQEEGRVLEELERLRKAKADMEAARGEAAENRGWMDAVEAVRRTLEASGPEIARALLRRISSRATGIYRELLGQPAVSLEWGTDYEIRCRIRAEEREFKQLSGGEQMAAALAVRLALLQSLSNLRMAFLDEPTAHMDAARRGNLAAQIQNLRSFDQLVVISHDDSFDTLFGHVVRLVKRDGATVVEP